MLLKWSLAHKTRENAGDGIEEVDGKGGDSSIEVVEYVALDASSCERVYQKDYYDSHAAERNENREGADHQQKQHKAAEAVLYSSY